MANSIYLFIILFIDSVTEQSFINLFIVRYKINSQSYHTIISPSQSSTPSHNHHNNCHNHHNHTHHNQLPSSSLQPSESQPSLCLSSSRLSPSPPLPSFSDRRSSQPFVEWIERMNEGLKKELKGWLKEDIIY